MIFFYNGATTPARPTADAAVEAWAIANPAPGGPPRMKPTTPEVPRTIAFPRTAPRKPMI